MSTPKKESDGNVEIEVHENPLFTRKKKRPLRQFSSQDPSPGIELRITSLDMLQQSRLVAKPSNRKKRPSENKGIENASKVEVARIQTPNFYRNRARLPCCGWCSADSVCAVCFTAALTFIVMYIYQFVAIGSAIVIFSFFLFFANFLATGFAPEKTQVRRAVVLWIVFTLLFGISVVYIDNNWAVPGQAACQRPGCTITKAPRIKDSVTVGAGACEWMDFDEERGGWQDMCPRTLKRPVMTNQTLNPFSPGEDLFKITAEDLTAIHSMWLSIRTLVTSIVFTGKDNEANAAYCNQNLDRVICEFFAPPCTASCSMRSKQIMCAETCELLNRGCRELIVSANEIVNGEYQFFIDQMIASQGPMFRAAMATFNSFVPFVIKNTNCSDGGYWIQNCKELQSRDDANEDGPCSLANRYASEELDHDLRPLTVAILSCCFFLVSIVLISVQRKRSLSLRKAWDVHVNYLQRFKFNRTLQRLALVVLFSLVPLSHLAGVVLESEEYIATAAITYAMSFAAGLIFWKDIFWHDKDEIMRRSSTSESWCSDKTPPLSVGSMIDDDGSAKSDSETDRTSAPKGPLYKRLKAFYSKYLSFRTGKYGFHKFLLLEVAECFLQIAFLFTTCHERNVGEIIISTSIISINLISTPAMFLVNARKETMLLFDAAIDLTYLLFNAEVFLKGLSSKTHTSVLEFLGVYTPFINILAHLHTVSKFSKDVEANKENDAAPTLNIESRMQWRWYIPTLPSFSSNGGTVRIFGEGGKYNLARVSAFLIALVLACAFFISTCVRVSMLASQCIPIVGSACVWNGLDPILPFKESSFFAPLECGFDKALFLRIADCNDGQLPHFDALHRLATVEIVDHVGWLNDTDAFDRAGLDNLKHLESVYIEGTEFARIPKSFAPLLKHAQVKFKHVPAESMEWSGMNVSAEGLEMLDLGIIHSVGNRLKHVDLSQNYISDIDRLFFSKKHPHLEVINISGNSIERSSPSGKIIDVLPQLSTIDVSNNRIAFLDRQYPSWWANGQDRVFRFHGNPVKKIFWDICSLEQLPSDTFELNLTYLGVSGNNLPNLNPRIANQRFLEGIDIFGNGRMYPSYPDMLNSMERVKEIVVGGMGSKTRNFTTIRFAPVITAPSLEILSYSYGALDTTILSNFSSLRPHLKVLNLEGNAIPYLADIGEFRALEKLQLSHNRFMGFSPLMSGLSKLGEINLKSNRLRYLPSEIAALPSLRKLDVRDNPHLFGELGDWKFDHIDDIDGKGRDQFNLLEETWLQFNKGYYQHIEGEGFLQFAEVPFGQVLFNATTTKRVPDELKLKCNETGVECLPEGLFRL